MLHSKKLRSLIVLLLTCFLILIASYSEANTDRSFIWSFESGGNTVYLLGSIHVLNREAYPLPPAVEAVYDCCRRVVFETDINSMEGSSLQAKMLRRGMYPPGQTLSGNISSDTYELLKNRLERSGLSVALFEKFRPWMVAMTLAGSEMIRLGFDPALGVDRRFFNKAVEDDKEMTFLESNEFQIDLFAGLGRTRQEALLRQILTEITVIESMFHDLVDSWKRGEVEKLDAIMKESFNGFPDIYDRLIVKRNRRWVSKILNLARQQGDLLVVVGAGHLAGKDSVVDLLRKKGYEVRQR